MCRSSMRVSMKYFGDGFKDWKFIIMEIGLKIVHQLLSSLDEADMAASQQNYVGKTWYE